MSIHLKREISPKIALLLSTQVTPNLPLLEAMETAQRADVSEADRQQKHNEAISSREWRDTILEGMNSGTKRHDKATAKREKAVAKEEATQAALTKATQQKTKAHAKLEAEKKKKGKKKTDDAMTALTGGLFDPLPVAPVQQEEVEGQEGKAVEVGEREEEATVKTITSDDGADKRARILSCVARIPSGALTLQDVLGNRDVASQLIAFTSSPLLVAFTSHSFMPLVESALTRLDITLTQDSVPANALTISSRFLLLSELTLECSGEGYKAQLPFFTQAVVQSSLRERLNYLKFDFHMTLQSAILDVFFAAPWPNLRAVGGDEVLNALLVHARQHPGSLDRIEKLLGTCHSIHLLAEAICDNMLPRIRAVEGLKHESWRHQSQLVEHLIRVLGVAPLCPRLHMVLYGDETGMDTLLQAVRAPPYLFSGLRDIFLRSSVADLGDFLTALGTVGTAPHLEALQLDWWSDGLGAISFELEPQAWPAMRSLVLHSRDLDSNLDLLTGLFHAAGAGLQHITVDEHAKKSSWGASPRNITILTHVLSLLKDDDQILWRDSLVSLSLPCFNRSHAAPSEMCRNIKTALSRLPRLQELALGLGSFAAILALVETIEAGALPGLRVVNLNNVVLNNEALFFLVAWLKLERDGLAAQLQVQRIAVHQSFYRDLINGIGLARLELGRG